MADLLKGRKLARKIRAEIAEEIQRLGGRPPGLAVILVGEDPASEVYVSYKEKACAKAGIKSTVARLPETLSQEQVLERVSALNADPTVDGLLVQLPLPDQVSESDVAASIDPAKDVDGLHPENVGRLWRGEPGLYPCTPMGIMKLLEVNSIPVDGANAVIVGRSNIVGKPLAAMLMHRHATISVAHSHTSDLPGLASRADILVSAVGRPGIIGPDFVKPGATVIDVGISRTEDGLRGDVDFDAVIDKCGAITPVPGGVGPLTIAFLLENTMISWRKANGVGA